MFWKYTLTRNFKKNFYYELIILGSPTHKYPKTNHNNFVSLFTEASLDNSDTEHYIIFANKSLVKIQILGCQ
jgi:hypothetical protein